MQKIILISVLCTGLIVTMPVSVSGLDRQAASWNLVGSGDQHETRSTDSLLAQDRHHQARRYDVYYRRPRDPVWIFGVSMPVVAMPNGLPVDGSGVVIGLRFRENLDPIGVVSGKKM